jgi:UDP:flavonoid glycosyltransferase YjiC (YdhE family)
MMGEVVKSVQPAVAHVYPTFQLATDLRERGHTVTYVSSQTWLTSYVRDHGFAFYQLALKLPDLARTTGRTGGMLSRLRAARHEAKAVSKVLNDELPLSRMIGELRPDIVLIDSTISLFALPLVAWLIPSRDDLSCVVVG